MFKNTTQFSPVEMPVFIKKYRSIFEVSAVNVIALESIIFIKVMHCSLVELYCNNN
jgi:hypothetical protein